MVGVSGGPDSLCLLHLFWRAAARLSLSLQVATLDHGLRGVDSAADAAFVEETARAWQLPIRRAYRDVSAIAQTHGLGIEEAARRTRYTFLAEVAQAADASVIAVGHNADDQAETIVMHLLRGSGLAGLRGMLPATPLSAHHLLPGALPSRPITLIRPLLDIPRADIDAYCAAHHLQPRQDATNVEVSYLRNRLRHEVLPLLTALNPNIRQTLARAGHALAADYAFIEQSVADELQAELRDQTEDAIALSLDRFRRPELSTAIRRGLLRQAILLLAPDLGEVGFATIDGALAVALHGHTGRQAALPGGIMLRVEYDTLTFRRPGAAPHPPPAPWLPAGARLAVEVPGETHLPDSAWTLHTRWLNPGEDPARFYGQPLTAVLLLPARATLALRTRRPGDRYAPLGLGGRTQKISDAMIDAKIPAPQRDHVPLLTVNDQIAWIVMERGSRVSDTFAVGGQTGRYLLARWVRYQPIP